MIRTILYTTLLGALIACTSQPKEEKQTEQQNTQDAAVATMPLDEGDTITVVASGANMSEMRFDKKAIRVPANKQITVKLINESTDATMPHNLVFIQPGTANDVGQAGISYKENAYVNPDDGNVIAHSPLAQMDETVYFSFTTPAAGEYEFICSYPGHWGLMKGKFVTR